jgi:hypothetical protein
MLDGGLSSIPSPIYDKKIFFEEVSKKAGGDGMKKESNSESH